jgi:CHAT domain-containing protein/ankyrin repeat protein
MYRLITLILICFIQSLQAQNLIEAIKNNDITLAKKLIKKGESVNQTDSNGATTLMWAALKSDLKFCKYLVKKGANPKQKGVIYLDSTHNQYYGNLVGICVMNDKYDILEWLVKQIGLDINDREYNKEDNAETGWIPLQFAVYKGNERGIDLLIKLGANKNYISVNDSSNILLDAINYGNTKLAKKILSMDGINFYQKNTSGFNALHYAVYLNQYEIAELLIKTGFDVNVQNDSLLTPLHGSVSSYFPPITKLLIQNNADTSLKNIWGETPGYIARINGCKGLQNILKHNYECLILPIYDSLYKSFDYYYTIGNDDSVIKYCALLYEQAGREFYENTGKFGQALNNAGVGFYKSKKYAEARQFFKLSLAYSKIYRPQDTSEQIQYLENIINSYAIQNEVYDSMVIYFNEFIPLTKVFKGDTSAAFFEAWRLKLFYYSKSGNFNDIVMAYNQLINYCDSVGNNTTEAYFNTLNSLVVLYGNEGLTEKTLITFNKILIAYQKKVLPSGFNFPHALKNICIFLTGQSDSTNIEPYLSIYKSFVINKKPMDYLDLYTYSFLKGAYFLNVQKFDSSLICYNNCLMLSHNYIVLPENDLAYTYLKKAEVLIKVNQFEEANWFLDTAISRFNSVKKLEPNYFGDVNSILNTYYNFMEFKMVLKLNPILIKMALLKNDTSFLLNALRSRFLALYYDDQIENSLETLNEILVLQNTVYKNSPINKLPFFIETGQFYAQIKDTAKAIEFYTMAIELASTKPNKDSIKLAMNYRIAMLRMDYGKKEFASTWLENEAMNIEKKKTYNVLEKEILQENINQLINSGNSIIAIDRCKFWTDLFTDRDFNKFVEWRIKTGDVYGKKDDFVNAELIYKSVEAALLKKYTENDQALVLIHAKLGNIYFRNNQYALALPYFKKVIEVEEKNGASATDLKSYYSSLKKIYYGINDLVMAEIFSDKLINITSNDIKSDFKTYLSSRDEHIFIKQQLGKYEDAEITANELLLKMYRYPQFKNEDRISIYGMTAAFYSEIGNKEKAIFCADSGYAITFKYFSDNIKKTSDATVRKGLLYINNGKSNEGLSLLRNNYLTLKNKVSDTSEYLNETLNYLGLAYMYHNQIDSAISTLKIVRNNYLNKSVTGMILSTSLNYLSAVYLNKRQYDSGLITMRLAKNIAMKEKGKLERYWDLYLEMSHFYSLLKNYDSAQIVVDEIMTNQNTIGLNKDVFEQAQLYKAYLLSDLGKYDESYALLSTCMNVKKDKILDKILFLSAYERENFISSKSNDIRTINQTLVKYIDKAPQLGNLILDNEIFIKGLALETNTKLLQMASTSTNPELEDLLDKIKTGKSKLDNLYTQGKSGNLETIELENKITAWEKSLNKKLGSDFKEDYKKNYTLEIKNKLKPTEVLIDFFSQEKSSDKDTNQYFAILLAKDYNYPKIVKVTNNKALIKLFTNSDNSSSADQLARIYEIRGSKFVNNKLSDLKNCYDLIWKKIDSLIVGKKDIYITPSGYLNKIAFAAIKDTHQVYISDKYNIHVLSSSRQILNAENPKIPKKKVGLILGGIDYDNDSSIRNKSAALASRSYTFDSDSTRSGFNYLEGTLTETNKIVSYLSERKYTVKYFTGKQATEEQFKLMQSSNPYFIHIATHGFYLPEANKNKNSFSQKTTNPLLRSGLILAGGNKAWLGKPIAVGEEDGILNSFEISNLDLRQTKFVVLSACETGLGDIKGSEGVFGLQRAFKLAGVEYIINSLWQVPDEQTSELMQNLYFHWAKGVPFEEAFFKAQKTLKAKYPPYYWAAFQLVK